MKTLITTSLILLLVGCGSRKAEVEKLRLEIKEQREMVLSIQNNIQSNVRVTKVASRTVVEPVDESEISTFNGTSFQNARITIEETETDSTANVNDQSETNLSLNEESEVDIKEKDKKSESKKGNPWIWFGIVVVSIFLIWMFFNKKKGG